MNQTQGGIQLLKSLKIKTKWKRYRDFRTSSTVLRTRRNIPTDLGNFQGRLAAATAAALPRLPKYYNLLLESVYRWKLITSHHCTTIIHLGAPNSVTVIWFGSHRSSFRNSIFFGGVLICCIVFDHLSGHWGINVASRYWTWTSRTPCDPETTSLKLWQGHVKMPEIVTVENEIRRPLPLQVKLKWAFMASWVNLRQEIKQLLAWRTEKVVLTSPLWFLITGNQHRWASPYQSQWFTSPDRLGVGEPFDKRWQTVSVCTCSRCGLCRICGKDRIKPQLPVRVPNDDNDCPF